MKYYKIIHRADIDFYPLIGQKPLIFNNLGRNHFDLQNCTLIHDWNSANTLFFDPFDVKEDYIFNHLPCPVISSRIKEDMEQSGITGVQYLPIRLEQMNNENNTIPGYYVLNILNKEPKEIIDPELSKIAPFGHAWVGFFEKKITGYDIFRIEGEGYEFFISEKLKKIIEKYVHSVEFSKIKTSK